MNTKSTNIITKNKDYARVFAVTVLLLLIPLLGNWPWTASDFVIMGILLVGTGLLLVLAARKVKNVNHRIVAVIVLLLAFFFVWAELAVGLFGSPFAGS